jgi:nucleotide-binding universal stress UspA family protein
MDAQTPGIVVGYDGSSDADTAAAWAARTAVLRDEPVTALIVMDPADMPHGHAWPEPRWREIEDGGRRSLQGAGATAIRVERKSGPTTATLVDSAQSASMLVLGSKGHGRVAEILLSSVSQRAARRAHCPVVVVRPSKNPDARRVVVGVDGSEASLRALDFACRYAALTHDRVAVVRAWHGPHTMPIDKHGDVPSSTSSTLLNEEKAVEEVVARAQSEHPGVAIEADFIGSDPSHALVDSSAQASLVVVGTQGLNALGETVLGSVSQHVLHRAHCPVAVVH